MNLLYAKLNNNEEIRMAYINDLVFDSGLSYVQTNGTRIHILSSDIGGTLGSLAAATEGLATGVTCSAPQPSTV